MLTLPEIISTITTQHNAVVVLTLAFISGIVWYFLRRWNNALPIILSPTERKYKKLKMFCDQGLEFMGEEAFLFQRLMKEQLKECFFKRVWGLHTQTWQRKLIYQLNELMKNRSLSLQKSKIKVILKYIKRNGDGYKCNLFWLKFRIITCTPLVLIFIATLLYIGHLYPVLHEIPRLLWPVVIWLFVGYMLSLAGAGSAYGSITILKSLPEEAKILLGIPHFGVKKILKKVKKQSKHIRPHKTKLAHTISKYAFEH